MHSDRWEARSRLVPLGAGLLAAAVVSASVAGLRVAEPSAAASEPVLTASTAQAAVSTPAPSNTPVPILMYHVIADPPLDAPYPELYVRAADFAGQMRWLERHGYQPVTLRAVWDHWRRGAPLPERAIVVSFDDGHRSVALAALPTMRDRGLPGVLNLTVKNLDRSWGLSARQVRELIAAGWEINAHSLTHPDLTGLGRGELDREIAGSREELQRRFATRVDFFCYPAGQYDLRVIAAVRRAGFLGATTTIDGLAGPNQPYELRRIRVSRGDGVVGFATKLEGLVG